MDADTGELVTLHSDVVGYSFYPGTINTGSAKYIFLDDLSGNIYALTFGSSETIMYRGYWNKNGVTNVTIQYLSAAKTLGMLCFGTSAGNKVIGVAGDYSYSYFDLERGLVSTFSDPYAIFTTNYAGYINGSSGHLYFSYYSRSSPSGNITHFDFGSGSYSGAPLICGVRNDTIFILLNRGSSDANGNMYNNYKLSVDSSGFQSSTGWFPIANSQGVHIVWYCFDSSRIYMFLKKGTTSGTGYANKIFIYDMETGTSNMSSISFNSTIPIDYPYGGSALGYIHSQGKAYVYLWANDAAKTDSIMQVDILTGEYSVKQIVKKPNGLGLYTINALTLDHFLRTIAKSAIYEDGSFAWRGYIINWNSATIKLGFGMIRGGVVSTGTSGSKYIYPELVSSQYYSSSSSYGYPGAIFNIGTNTLSKAIAIASDSGTDRVIGEKEIRFYMSFV